MAAAAPSPLASSVEKTNGAKLSRLLIDGGTTVLRNVFDGYHPPAVLAANLSTNCVTLNNLFRRKVLHKPQWDLLFPPGGATPDSKTFDITLLFLLLTNICGLSPPLSGWHKPPPSFDTSLEANLARVKLYRNELYGHVTSTGLQTAVFNVKWQEIGAFLIALGLNPAEVVRLRSAPCGNDYISAVIEWVKSDEEIKSQLREVLETQQEARQIQEEDHRTLHDTHKAVEGVQQIQQDMHQVVEDVLTIQQEEHQKQQKARQIQEEDHRTLQDTHQVVEKVLKIQEARQIQEEDHRTLEDTHKAVKRVQHIYQDTHRVVEKVRKTQEEAVKTQKEDHETLQQVKTTVENMAERCNKDKEDEFLSKLAKINTQKAIEYHAERYQEGTRLSFFENVEKWLDDRSSSNRVMVISGNAGMGKSVISAVVCKRMQQADRLSGSHFCQHDKARYRNGKVLLQSLACQLSDSLPEYKNTLVNTLSTNLGVELNHMEVKDLFEVLFEEPLSKLKDPDRNILMVIDGLDESEYQGRNELLDVIANHFTKLPPWIRFLVTTRPEINIADSLKSFNPLQLEPKDKENLMDLRLLFKKRLSDVIQKSLQEIIITELVKRSEGLILYAHLLVLFVKESVSLLTPEQLDNTLPSGISSVYQTYFKRLEKELCKELKITEVQFLIFVSALTAAREPLPLDFITKMMLLGTSSLADQRKVEKAMACISALLPVRDDCVHFFHKSVRDWLTDTSLYGRHNFTVVEKEGHRILTELCTDELDDIKRTGVGSAQFSGTEKYALKHCVKHVLQLKEDARSCISLEVVIKKYVVDLELVYAKLCVSTATASEDILQIQKQEIFPLLSEDCKDLLNTFAFLLKKYFGAITNHPPRVLQIVLNAGGTPLSSVASNLLKNIYPEIPYMEFVHKQMQQGAVLARFQCSSYVACYDVSPRLDYMVCECTDGTIQLWSLHTGKLEWTRPVMVKKRNWISMKGKTSSPSHIGSFYRSSFLDVFSIYRSVVFHPTADVVLPGVLNQAYFLDGDLKPLFPESNCRFTVCSVSGDKTKMLTDCPDDAKCIIMWSLENGSEITRTKRNAVVLSFAWSQDGKLLAISHSTVSFSIVNAMDGFRTLAETVLPKECGMIKFSPDCRSLCCLHHRRNAQAFCHWNDQKIFLLNINMAKRRGCTLNDSGSYVPWKFESHSEAGFLLGDPIPSVDGAFDFVLDTATLLRSCPFPSCINMLNVSESRKASLNRISDIVFSLSGETVYVVGDADRLTVSAWDVSSMKLIGQKSRHTDKPNLVAVKEGVILTTASGTLELWNSELSKCVRSWTNAFVVTKIIPVSGERVACEAEDKVIILDTTSGEIASTFRIRSNGSGLVTCNSKCQLLTYDIGGSLKLWDGKTTLWKENLHLGCIPLGIFSLSDQFVVIWALDCVYVLDALSGKTLHVLLEAYRLSDCTFVSDEECVISTVAALGDNCLQLFNVKSGDLLSVIDLENDVHCLAACPCKRLLAIGQSDSKHGFELIQVCLPQDKDSRKSKSMANTPEIEERRENTRCVLV